VDRPKPSPQELAGAFAQRADAGGANQGVAERGALAGGALALRPTQGTRRQGGQEGQEGQGRGNHHGGRCRCCRAGRGREEARREEGREEVVRLLAVRQRKRPPPGSQAEWGTFACAGSFVETIRVFLAAWEAPAPQAGCLPLAR